MAPGVAGELPAATDFVRAIELPHAEAALTLIVPGVEPAVTMMELPVEVPVQPLGNVQV